MKIVITEKPIPVEYITILKYNYFKKNSYSSSLNAGLEC